MIDEERGTQGSLTYWWHLCPAIGLWLAQLGPHTGLVWRPHVDHSGLEWLGCSGSLRLTRNPKWRRWSRLGPGYLKVPFLPPQVTVNSLPALRGGLSFSAAETVAGLDQP